MKSPQVLSLVLLLALACTGLGNREYLRLLDQSELESDTYAVRLNVQGQHCLQGCMNGGCYAEHGRFECVCRGNWSGDDCSQHICESNPCQNGGVCVQDGDGYLCVCPFGLTGEFCNLTTQGGACCNNPCNNSGTCYNKVGGGYLCICPPGYYGANCDFDDNHLCISEGVENCFNHGFCEIIYQNRGPFPFCHCYEDYDPSSKCKFRSYRDNCKFDIPCNNGTCHYIEGGIYSCECPSDATGRNCTEYFDPCEPNPCANRGTCQPAYGGHYYTCNCPANYGGYTCEGVYLELNNVVYPNNSAVPLSHVGEGSGALHCRTNYSPCCGTPGERHGQFYYPNGTQVPVEGDGYGFYRNRGEQFISLHRKILTTSGAGKYRCEIPDEWGNTRKLYITLK